MRQHVERSETAEAADLLHEYIQKDPQGGLRNRLIYEADILAKVNILEAMRQA